MEIKLVKLPCEQFLQALEIYCSLFRVKQVGEKRAKIQNPLKNFQRQLLKHVFALEIKVVKFQEISRFPRLFKIYLQYFQFRTVNHIYLLTK